MIPADQRWRRHCALDETRRRGAELNGGGSNQNGPRNPPVRRHRSGIGSGRTASGSGVIVEFPRTTTDVDFHALGAMLAGTLNQSRFFLESGDQITIFERSEDVIPGA